MNRIFAVLLLVGISGCAGMLPSFWDDNQSRACLLYTSDAADE